MIYKKAEILEKIKGLEEQQKTVFADRWDRLEASKQVWLSRLRDLKKETQPGPASPPEHRAAKTKPKRKPPNK